MRLKETGNLQYLPPAPYLLPFNLQPPTFIRAKVNIGTITSPYTIRDNLVSSLLSNPSDPTRPAAQTSSPLLSRLTRSPPTTMASDASDTSDASDASSEVEEIILNPDSDATIAVFMITDDSTEEVQFHVSSRIVRELELQGDKPEIRLGTHVAASITSVGLLLSGMEANGNTDALPPEFFALPIVDVWRVLTLVDVTAVRHYRPGCYRVPCSILAAWFTKWFQTQSPGFSQRDEYEQLLYPAFAFGIPAVFAAVTAWLAYDVASQIREQNPLREEEELPFRPYRDMHMPKEVIRKCGSGELVSTVRSGKLTVFFRRGSRRQGGAPGQVYQTPRQN